MANEYKIAVVGKSGSGKSSLVVQFVENIFLEKYDPTIEDSFRKNFVIDKKACILIADSSGPESFAEFNNPFVLHAQGFLMVYSVNCEYSLPHASELRREIIRRRKEDNIPMVLVGNKCDLETERKIPKSEALNLATQFKCKVIETSAKTKENVEEAFFELVRTIRLQRTTSDQPSNCFIL